MSRLLLACLSLVAATTLFAAPPARRPNIVMIAIDDLNDWIGALGGPAKTPHLDRLAASGVLFRNAYCVVPACNPSRVAIMTGLRPETTGQYANEGNFRQQRPGNTALLTLPQRLAALGYETRAAGKIFHHPRGQGPRPAPLSDPVSWQDQFAGPTGTGGTKNYQDANGMAKWLRGDRHGIRSDYAVQIASLWGPIDDATEQTGDWQTAGQCADYLAQKHDRPYFIACGLSRPHAPLLAPKKYFDLYPLDQVKLPDCPPDDMADIPAIAQANWSTPLVHAIKQENQWRLAVQAYLACVSFTDDCVGRILDAVERSPERDNTIVILWSDHGWQLGHKDRWEKFSLWKQGTRATFIIRAPGLSRAGCDRAVSFLDIAPTVLELVGAPVTPELEGVSLLPWLKDPAAPRTRPAVVTYLPGNHSVVLDRWNYIRYSDGSEELYDHTADAPEFHNLIGQPGTAAIAARLRAFLPVTPPADFKTNKTADN